MKKRGNLNGDTAEPCLSHAGCVIQHAERALRFVGGACEIVLYDKRLSPAFFSDVSDDSASPVWVMRTGRSVARQQHRFD